VVRLASLPGWCNLQGCSNNATEHASSALIFGLAPIMRSTRIKPSPSRAGSYLHPIHRHHARPFLCALGHRHTPCTADTVRYPFLSGLASTLVSQRHKAQPAKKGPGHSFLPFPQPGPLFCPQPRSTTYRASGRLQGLAWLVQLLVVTKRRGISTWRYDVLVTTHNTLRSALLFYRQPLGQSDRDDGENREAGAIRNHSHRRRLRPQRGAGSAAYPAQYNPSQDEKVWCSKTHSASGH
jgi:hypothetical protein